MNEIQDDLDLHPQFSKPVYPDPVSAQNLQNLTTAQSAQIIENTDGMEEYKDFGTVETVDYNNPDLELDTRSEDKLEYKIFKKSFKKTTENDLLAFSKNKTVEEIQTVKDNYKGNDFNGDIQKFVKTQ